MNAKSQGFEWDELKEIWTISSRTKEIHIQLSKLVEEVKEQASQFEKDAIEDDLASLKVHWISFMGKISDFEKESIKKDLSEMTSLINKFLNIFKKND